MRAIGYLRVSTQEQDGGLDAQRSAIGAWAAREGAEVVAWHTDHGVSGGAAFEDCPGLVAAVGALKAGWVLAVAKRDRIGRDVMRCAIVSRLCERKRARIVSADGAGNGDGPEHSLMASLLSAFAAYELALIKSRTRSVLRVKARRGERVSFFAPFGYRFDGGMAVLEPGEQAMLAMMREGRAKGLKLREVAEALNQAGYTTRRGSGWTPAKIAKTMDRQRLRADRLKVT